MLRKHGRLLTSLKYLQKFIAAWITATSLVSGLPFCWRWLRVVTTVDEKPFAQLTIPGLISP
jgi:hypothetical protein